MKKKIRTKIIVDHKKDCDSLRMVRQGDWDTPWALLGQTWKEEKGYYHRDKQGGKRSINHTWLRAICNSTDCPGRIIVNEDDILNLIFPRPLSTTRP